MKCVFCGEEFDCECECILNPNKKADDYKCDGHQCVCNNCVDTAETEGMPKEKIYCYISGTFSNGDVHVSSVLVRNNIVIGLAGHLSSSVAFAKHDIGIDSDRKHDFYEAECKGGFELEWVDDIKNHPVLGPHVRTAEVKN